MKQINRDKPTILYLVTNSNLGGAQTHMLELMVGLRDRYNVALAVGDEGYLSAACNQLEIPVYLVPSLRRNTYPLQDVMTIIELRRLLCKLQPDLIHLHTFKAGFLGRVAAFGLGIPAVYTLHAWLWGTDEVSYLTSRLGITLERIGAWFCDRYITVSEAGRKLVEDNGIRCRNKIVTIHNGVSESDLVVTHIDKPEPIVTMVARFTPAKDFACLIRAFARLPLGPKLWLVGDGNTRPSMEVLSRQLGMQDRIQFLGECRDVSSLLLRSDILVLSTHTEMFPICILEAMRSGLPVVATNVGGVSEAVEDGINGILINKNSVEELSAALQILCSDVQTRKRMGEAGRKLYEQKFTATRMHNEIIALYSELIDHP